MTDTTNERAARIAAIEFEVIVSTEDKQNAAIIAIPSSAVTYKNPHYQHEKGWTLASAEVEEKAQLLRADIAGLLAERDALRAERARVRELLRTGFFGRALDVLNGEES